jgi:hypothetical protein
MAEAASLPLKVLGLGHKIILRGLKTSDYVCYLSCTGEPESLGEAMENAKWKEAMNVEYDALMRNNT